VLYIPSTFRINSWELLERMRLEYCTRGCIVFFCKKCEKIKIFRFECQCQGMTFLNLTFSLNFEGEKMGFRFWSKIRDSDFSQKYDFSFQSFSRSLVKLRRTAKRPIVLNSLLPLLTIPITLRKFYFLTNFRIFLGFATLGTSGCNPRYI